MLPIPIVKLGAQVVAGMGVSKIVGDIVKNNVPIMTTAQSVAVKAGTFVLGSMLVEQSSNHISRMVDDVIVWYEKKKNDSDLQVER